MTTTPLDPDQLARRLRRHALIMTHQASASHVASCLSIADILAVLYTRILNVNPEKPDWHGRDRLVFSKGHAAAILYAALAERGFFPTTNLNTFAKNGSALGAHVSHHDVPGVDAASGSLGHGLPLACGMALAGRTTPRFKVFAVLSDGELNEGSTWEAALFAPHHQLDNLTVIIDANGIQSFGRTTDILNTEPLSDKWEAFGWTTRSINGHDTQEIENTLRQSPNNNDKPSVVIARTIKGKGVPFMEDQLIWHYRNPSDQDLKDALHHLERERPSHHA